MNKILRIVGYVVLVLALVGSSVLFVQKNKEHDKLAGIQEKLEQAKADYEQNQITIDNLQAQIQTLREGAQYTVRSASLPLYESNLPTIPRAKLSKGEVVYVDSTDENGMAHVTAEVNGEEGQYYTFATLLTKDPAESTKTVVVSLETENRQVEYDQELPLITALGEALKAAGIAAVWPIDQESCGNDWNLIAADCGADAHLILRAGAEIEGGNTCFVGIPMGVENETESMALSRRIASMLAINNLAEMPSEEPVNDETLEESDVDSEEDKEVGEEVTEGTVEGEESAEPAEEPSVETETPAAQKLTCLITANIIKVQNAEVTETEESEGQTEEVSESEESEGEETEGDVPEETGMNTVDLIVNSIVAGVKDFWGIQ